MQKQHQTNSNGRIVCDESNDVNNHYYKGIKQSGEQHLNRNHSDSVIYKDDSASNKQKKSKFTKIKEAKKKDVANNTSSGASFSSGTPSHQFNRDSGEGADKQRPYNYRPKFGGKQ
jgi:hypothetical protein